MTEKTTKPAAKRVSMAKPKPTRRRKPSHDQIATRAYFLHLEAPTADQIGNWLRAERELSPA